MKSTLEQARVKRFVRVGESVDLTAWASTRPVDSSGRRD